MARAYTITTAALALRMPLKWLDNTLSHHKVSGIQQQRQGVARRLTIDGLLTLAVAIVLINDLAIPLLGALQIADKLIRNGGRYTSAEGVDLQLHLETLKARLFERLENAVEIAPVPKRGRPPKNKTGRLE
jgi:hypothetical protein